MLRSGVIKRSIVVDGFYTSVSLEDVFWEELRELAQSKNSSIAKMISGIRAEQDPNTNLSSAIRVAIVQHYRALLKKTIKTKGSDSSGASEMENARRC